MARLRIAVVSPTIDKRHGTERRVAECISRLAAEHEIHVYSQAVADVDLSKVTWHRIRPFAGPHLLGYLWWFTANHLRRWWDTRSGRAYDLVYSPGINCLDADVATVHIVFSDYRERLAQEHPHLFSHPLRFWPRLIHRRVYYRLISAIEQKVYRRRSLWLGSVSQMVAEDLRRRFAPANPIRVIYQGTDAHVFNPPDRLRRRVEMRRFWGLAEEDFVLLLIGNGWKTKGLTCLLEAAAKLPDLPVKVLVAGRDDQRPFAALQEKLGLAGRVHYLEPSPDVMRFYAAADVYTGPSLHDSFAQPPAEAMACGLPVITSRSNGGAEMIAHGTDGFILQDARDSGELARLIRRLYDDPELRRRLGENAARTAAKYTWEQNAEEMRRLFEQAIDWKSSHGRSRLAEAARRAAEP